jgi:hypothetical protein
LKWLAAKKRKKNDFFDYSAICHKTKLLTNRDIRALLNEQIEHLNSIPTTGICLSMCNIPDYQTRAMPESFLGNQRKASSIPIFYFWAMPSL